MYTYTPCNYIVHDQTDKYSCWYNAIIFLLINDTSVSDAVIHHNNDQDERFELSYIVSEYLHSGSCIRAMQYLPHIYKEIYKNKFNSDLDFRTVGRAELLLHALLSGALGYHHMTIEYVIIDDKIIVDTVYDPNKHVNFINQLQNPLDGFARNPSHIKCIESILHNENSTEVIRFIIHMKSLYSNASGLLLFNNTIENRNGHTVAFSWCPVDLILYGCGSGEFSTVELVIDNIIKRGFKLIGVVCVIHNNLGI
uniref:Uncharacterized protein n=1 Tax=viral metagenome TaxID=1070528 RepID=A0A6C0LW80_9ZZZZ